MKAMAASKALAEILDTACEIANHEVRRRGHPVHGQVFAPWSEGTRLALHVQLDGREITDEYREIARDAVVQALMEHMELFVGVILGCARQGIDIFDAS